LIELCQTQSTNDAQRLADTLQILASLIPHVHETILNNVKYEFDGILYHFIFIFSILIFYLIYLNVYHRNIQ
jgi:hypothetical protein